MPFSQPACARALATAIALFFVLPVGGAFAQDATGVDMQAISFVDPVIHVAPGTTVVWTNSTPLVHTVTADDGSFDSGDTRRGDTFMQTFDTPGVYQYFCQRHGSAGLQGMAGAIVVDNADGTPVDGPVLPQGNTSPADNPPDH